MSEAKRKGEKEVKTLFKNARILTMQNENIIEGDLVVIDARIAYIGNDSSKYAPFDRVVECNKNVLMPGFKNAHAHSAMVFIQNKPTNINLQDWLFTFVFPREAKLIPSDIYHLNKVAYLEYVRGGITACFDHYFFPLEGAKAAEEFGMRTLLLGTPDPGKVLIDNLERNFNYFNSKKDGLVSYTVGFHAEYTADKALLEDTKKAIAIIGCPFYTHISETKTEVEGCLERHQMTPLKFLYEEGLFQNGGGGFHCIHLTDEEIKICKENKLSIVSCPGSNLYLQSGTAPLKKYLDNGINVALGTDGPASNEGLNMFREMQLAALNNEDIPAFEILKMATVNAARAMNMLNADVLDEGKYADIIMIDLASLKMNKSDNFINKIVYNGKQENIKLTMINGKILYEDGKFYLNEPVDKINEKLEEISRRIENEL